MARCVLLALLAGCVTALRLSRTLGDHMVLQRGYPGAIVWGFDDPGNVVSVVLSPRHGHPVLTTTTGADGIWRVRLPAVSAGGPYQLLVVSASGSAQLDDVMFGDVFLCGGQSNMQLVVSQAFNATQEISAATYPAMRIFTVGQDTSSPTPLTDLKTVARNWTVVSPASVPDFSAICYFFGRDIHTKLSQTVPIGLVSSNWGGTCIEAWAEPSVNTACGIGQDSTLFNAMIYPYATGPMMLTGFLWSQGECNADRGEMDFYACAFPKFIDSWRTLFQKPNAFFGFELLPAYIQDASFPPENIQVERASQLVGLTALGRNVVVSNALDLGDPTSPMGSVHPRDKQTVSHRFFLGAMALMYGIPMPYLNPAYAGAHVISSSLQGGKVKVFLDPASVGSASLRLVNATCPDAVPAWECCHFNLQTEDGVWLNATASLAEDEQSLYLETTEPCLSRIVATSGMYCPYPVVTVFSATGLPLLPWHPTPVEGETNSTRHVTALRPRA